MWELCEDTVGGVNRVRSEVHTGRIHLPEFGEDPLHRTVNAQTESWQAKFSLMYQLLHFVCRLRYASPCDVYLLSQVLGYAAAFREALQNLADVVRNSRRFLLKLAGDLGCYSLGIPRAIAQFPHKPGYNGQTVNAACPWIMQKEVTINLSFRQIQLVREPSGIRQSQPSFT